MVQVCCFQCDPRLATYIISVISTLHFMVEVILLSKLDTEHRLVAEDDGIKFYTVFSTHIFLLFASILLFCAGFTLQRFLCIPWLLGCAFNLIIYTALLILIFMRLLTDWSVVELEKGLFIALTIATLCYCIWIVLVFFMELGSNESSTITGETGGSGGERPKSRSIFRLYDTEDETEVEEDEEQKLFPPAINNKRSNNNKNGHISKTKITSSSGSKDDTVPLLNGSRR